MPLTTSLPAPDIVWVNKLSAPFAFQNPTSKFGNNGPRMVGASASEIRAHGRGGIMTANAGVSPNRVDSYQGVGSPSANIWDGVRGRGSMAMNSSENNRFTGGAMCPPDWLPQLTAVGAQNPGSFQDAGALVAVYDFHLWWDIAGASPMPDGGAGIWFTPYNVLADARSLPVDAAVLPFNTKFSGFGVFLNNVGGVGAYEYMSWTGTNPASATPVILERVPVPVSVVPALRSWNTIRFVVIGATNTAPATLSVQVNAEDIVPVRTFGSALLETPEGTPGGEMAGIAPGMVCGFNTGGTAFVWGQFHVKTGRFSPGGAAVEPA